MRFTRIPPVFSFIPHKNLGKSVVLAPVKVWFIRYPFVRLPIWTRGPIVEKIVDKNQTETFLRFDCGAKTRLGPVT